MNCILKISSGFLILFSCSNGSGRIENSERVPYPEKFIHDGYLALADSIKPKFIPDTSIGQISLNNTKNVRKYLGEDAMKRLIDNGLPNSFVLSSDSKQRLTFYFHPGNVKNCFSEFQVNYTKQPDRKARLCTDTVFVTESGIKLGMSMGEIRSIKGEPDSVSNGKMTVLYYQIIDQKNSLFLQRYRYPCYYANFTFKNGFLIEYKFGFEYP
ncbi:MAG TPA: hypothetical protein DIW47_06780 [Bacteroidetes bacterium]|nr:hypothetical protein [Bacteroidota bacterium]